MFNYCHSDSIAVLHLYIDDILFMASSTSLLQYFVQFLKGKFFVNDLGPLYYFPGIQITINLNGIVIL